MCTSKTENMDPNCIAIEFLCPVCNTLPNGDAVVAEDGFVYDRECIEKYFSGDDATSPMTRAPMGKTLIESSIINETIRELLECEELDSTLKKNMSAHSSVDDGNIFVQEIDDIAKVYIFDDALQRDKREDQIFYQLLTLRSQDDLKARVYQGICVIRGIGIEADWYEGFELLVDVATSDSSFDAKNIARYTLGMCYSYGVFGFKKDEVRSRKWLPKVVETIPSFVSDYWNDYVEEDHQFYNMMVFDDTNGQSTASTMTSLTEECTKYTK